MTDARTDLAQLLLELGQVLGQGLVVVHGGGAFVVLWPVPVMADEAASAHACARKAPSAPAPQQNN